MSEDLGITLRNVTWVKVLRDNQGTLARHTFTSIYPCLQGDYRNNFATNSIFFLPFSCHQEHKFCASSIYGNGTLRSFSTLVRRHEVCYTLVSGPSDPYWKVFRTLATNEAKNGPMALL